MDPSQNDFEMQFYTIWLLFWPRVSYSLGLELTPGFPPSLTWVNSLDTEEKLVAFLSSTHRLARQTVFNHNGTLLMGHNTGFTAKECIRRLLQTNTTHFLLMYATSAQDFRAAYRTVKGVNSGRLGVLANIEKGPNCYCPKLVPANFSFVGRNVVRSHLIRWPSNVRLFLGYTTLPGSVIEYSKWQMLWLSNTISKYQKILPIQYVIEYDALYLSNKYNLLDNVQTIKQNRWLVVVYSQNLSYAIDALALREFVYFMGLNNVYLNMPEEMVRLLAIEEDPRESSKVFALTGDMPLNYLLPLAAWLIMNKQIFGH